MGRRELIAALHLQGEKESRAIWHQAETEAARIKEAGDQSIEQRRTEVATVQARLIAEVNRPVLRNGQRQARTIRAEAKRALADKLYDLARQTLVQFRKDDDDGLFAALAKELPPLQWKEIRVYPADQQRAERHFPGAEIVQDPNLVGGMEVVDESGRIRVNNTLQKRLERSWPDLLPGLLKTILDKEEHR
jgi:V/A-type H+-transporting ATPase subunit E